MDSEGIGEVRSALAAFPGLADVVVVENAAEECLIAYVVPSGPGLDVPELHAFARKALLNGNMPAAIAVVDEIPKTPAGAVDIAALPVSLLERFAGDVGEKLIALLRFLGPPTGGQSAMRAF